MTEEIDKLKILTTSTDLQSSAPALWWLPFEAFGPPASHTCDHLDDDGYEVKAFRLLIILTDKNSDQRHNFFSEPLLYNN